jgi:hypothetical protein
LPFPGFDITIDEEFPHPHLDKTEAAVRLIAQRKLRAGNYLFKYGEYQFLERLVTHGEIQIRPASFYKDPSLNPGIQDDELSIRFQPSPNHLRMTVFNGQNGKEKGTLRPKDNCIQKKLTTNYYAYCLSTVFDPRLFLLSPTYNACLIIHDPKRYAEDLCSCLETALPKWTAVDLDVHYVDPILSPLFKVDPFRSKHFCYSYQQERRIVCLPPKPTDELFTLPLTIPGLWEYCELVALV